jgi:uncharacterized protein
MMKKSYTLLVSLAIILISQSISGKEIDKRSLTGSWLGKISAGAMELRVIFNLSVIEKDSLVATLDSPDQGVKNIKLGPVTFNGKTIKISAGALMAEYNGILINDTLIEGTWIQAGSSHVLNLVKQKADFILNRPQEPRGPFPYTSENVIIANNEFNINLSGTLTIPFGQGPFPAVILISGSGPQNRDEELMGHKPFLVIADFLSRNGIAVLRYDDRGVAKSQGNYSGATSANLATDAEAAFQFLINIPKIDQKTIGLIGHSEGALISAIVATSNSEISFIVSLAGTGVRGDKVIHRQSADIGRASGVEEKKIKESVSTNKKLYKILKKEPDNNIASEKMSARYRKILAKKGSSTEEVEKAVQQTQAGLSPDALTWFRYFIITNPSHFWKNVKCPVLALNGDKDLQVNAELNLKAIEKAIKKGGNKSIEAIRYPGLNHLFQHCKTGLPSEYGNIEETFSREVLKAMADWIPDQ